MNATAMLRTGAFAALLSLLAAIGVSFARDLWIHPRTPSYDADEQYRDASGEAYFEAENDIRGAMGAITVEPRGAVISIDLGGDLAAFAEHHGGSLRPVLLWDSTGDGTIDRSVRGRRVGDRVIFDSPRLEGVNLRAVHWQIGVRFIAGAEGGEQFDGRYLASVDSGTAQVAWRRARELADVALGVPDAGGLVILRHREGVPFDFAAFADNPQRYAEDFDLLTRNADSDDWTVPEGEPHEGELRTHLGREDLLLVRTFGGTTLDVEWGDVPIAVYFEDFLAAAPAADGCYSSLDSGLLNEDGTPAEMPHRILFCPDDSVALLDAPPGYEIGLEAWRSDDLVERTEASTSVGDNFRLYVQEVFKRNPRGRATGTVTGNIGAGFRDSGGDLADAFRHGITGTQRASIHTGQTGYRASTVTMLPRALAAVVLGDPLRALGEIFTGVDSTFQMAASTVSAVHNAVINPAFQATVGNVASPEAADTGSEYLGAFTQAAVKNLPFGERSLDAVSPVALVRHDRAFAPRDYTRTDTQLNIDRVMTAMNIAILRAIENHNDSSSSGRAADDDGGGGGGGGGGGPSPLRHKHGDIHKHPLKSWFDDPLRHRHGDIHRHPPVPAGGR